MHKRILTRAIVVVAAALTIAACDGLLGGSQIQAPKVFSLDLFEQNIRDAYAGSIGFTYAIAQNGVLVRSTRTLRVLRTASPSRSPS